MSVIAMPSRIAPDLLVAEEPTRLDVVSDRQLAVTAPEPNATGAAREVFIWLRQLAHDATLSPLALRVGIELSQHVDRRKGYAHPAHATIAAALDASRRGVQNALGQLQDRGHLDVRVSRGAGQANRYRLRVQRTSRAAT